MFQCFFCCVFYKALFSGKDDKPSVTNSGETNYAGVSCSLHQNVMKEPLSKNRAGDKSYWKNYYY